MTAGRPPQARERFEEPHRNRSLTFRAERNAEKPAGLVYALLACCERLDRIAVALEPVDAEVVEELPADRELLAAAADDARILAQHRGDDADAAKYGALWRQLAGVRVGVTGEPPREAAIVQAEEEGRCMTPLYKPERTPKQARGFPGPREVEAICFLEAGHHGSHRSERGHIWS